MKEYNPRLKQLILEVVENQLRDNDPPITRSTLKRLVDSGWSVDQAKERIAAVVAEHMFYTMHDDETFDQERYRCDLEALS